MRFSLFKLDISNESNRWKIRKKTGKHTKTLIANTQEFSSNISYKVSFFFKNFTYRKKIVILSDLLLIFTFLSCIFSLENIIFILSRQLVWQILCLHQSRLFLFYLFFIFLYCHEFMYLLYY